MDLDTRPASPRKSTDIAIIGMSCLFPDANGREEFWQRIKQGHDAIGPIPLTHWRPEDYFDADPKKPDHTYAKTGGFLKPYAFDPLKFGIAPHALEATDSTQLLGMVCAHEALVDAGYGPEKDFNRDRVSCVVGVTGTLELVIPLGARLGHPLWKAALDKVGVAPDQAQQVMDEIAAGYVSWQEASFPGLLGNVVAGRIASRLDLGGTNSVVDAACASSLAAVHLAVMELESGRADMVITGGMDTFNDIFMYMCFSKTPALSPSGTARPYDAEGDGTILGEGLGTVILKRLEDAERDGDRIYAVLRSVGSSSDGKGQAIYAPSAKGQAKALSRAYERAGISARSVELVEGHGTGTKVGDGVELEALTRVYRDADSAAAWCQLGSVKSQIGHTKAAAGAAGLIKAAMALHYKVLPPTIKVRQAHPKLLDSPFILSDKARPWVGHQAWPRRAAVSAFGFGGSNYHAVLEEFQSEKKALDWDPELQILSFSAESSAELLAAVRDARALMEQGWNGRGLGRKLRREFRSDAAERLCFVAADRAQLLERLSSAEDVLGRADAKDPLWMHRGSRHVPGQLAFIFAGQGSQEPGMLRELSCLFPEFLSSLQQGNEVLESMEPGELRLSDRIHPGQAFDEERKQEQRQQLTETRYAQLALGAMGSAVTAVLERFNVKPDAVAGHSYGELLALHAAGVLQQADLLRLSYQRGRLMKELGKPNGSMLAVMADAGTIQKVLDEHGLELEWANYNADKQIVLGADAEICQKAAAAFKKAGIGSRRLEVSTAFHTSFVEPAADAFLNELQAVEFGEARVRVYANLSGNLYPDSGLERKQTLSRQLAQPVRFADMLRRMQADGVRTFVEVGPQKKLSGLLKASADASVCLSLDADAASSVSGLAQVLAQLASLGYPVRLSAWDEGADLPLPLQQKNFTVMISGANYRSPQKPAAAKSARAGKDNATPAPMRQEPLPVVPAGKAAMVPAVAAMKPSVQADRIPTAPLISQQPKIQVAPSAEKPGAKPFQNATPHSVSHESKARFPKEGPMSSSNDSWQRLEKIMQDMHDIQRKTADAHTLFLENQRQFQSLLHGLMRGESLPPPAAQTMTSAPETAAVRPAAVPVAPAASPAAPTPLVAPSSLAAPAAVRPSVAATPVKVPSAVSVAAPVTSRATVKAQAVAVQSAVAVQVSAAPSGLAMEHVYEVLASCTGYPAELLKPEMNLESDLGIDSIKKVEIFSQLQSRFPHMEGDAAQLGELQSIGDLLKMAQQEEALANTGRSGAWAASSVALAASQSARDQQTVLEIIADKTGFPTSMLQPSMDLEADLGIDSIKKVEIFSALQDQVPQLTELKPETLHDMRSIKDLVALVVDGVNDGSFSEDEPTPMAKILSSEAEEVVYQILSEKTGYPLEVLTSTMNLESDLGIDSIKRVEIFAALADLVPSLQDATQVDVGTLDSVSDFIRVTRQGLGDAAAQAEQSLLEPDQRHADWDLSKKKSPVDSFAVDESEAVRVGATASALSLADALDADDYEDAWPETSGDALAALHLQCLEAECFQPQGEARAWRSGTEVWIGDDGSNLARNIMLKLQERGLQARLVSLAQADRLQAPDVLHGLILLAPLTLEVPPVRWLSQAFRLLKRCGPALKAVPEQSLVAVITRNGGRFGLDGLQNSSQVFGGALSAFAKTVAEEWTGVHARTLDLGRDFTDGVEAALRCLDAILLQGPVELGVSREQIFQLTLHDHKVEASTEKSNLRPGDLILVTGGARGVTAASLMPLARSWKPRFVIWGRTPLAAPESMELQKLTEPAALKRALLQQNPELSNPRELEAAYRQLVQQRELRDNIRLLESHGASVVYEAVDVSKDPDLRQAFQDLKDRHGTPLGIIHGAGVIRDKWILDQKDEEFMEVLDTKLRILPYVEECAKNGLAWVLLFSSSTARLGRKGQVAYGVANEALNKFAQYISSRYKDCHAMAFNWGPWAGGMVNDGLKKIFAAEGVATIPLESGAALVHQTIVMPPKDVHELVVLAHTEPQPGRAVTSRPPLSAFHINVKDVPVLLEHVIKNRAVVPAALLLEWMAAAAQALDPQKKILQIKDFRVWKGIVLDADQDIQVWIESVADSGTENPELVLCSESSLNKKLRHARARFVMGAGTTNEAMEASAALPADPLCHGLDPYAELLFHGDDLHLLAGIQSCTPEGVDATLALGHKPSDWSHVGLPEAWLISGEVVDAVFQAAIVWTSLQQGKPCLPAQVGELEILQPLPAEAVRLQLRIRRSEPLHLVADAEIINERNEVVMRLGNIEAVLDAGLVQAFRQTRLGSQESGIGAL